MSNVKQNEIDVTFSSTNIMKSVAARYQWDKGIVLNISGIESDKTIMAHCSFEGQLSPAVVVVTSMKNGICTLVIPDELFMQTKAIRCYLYAESSDTGVTVYEIRIPIIARPKPGDYVYDPTEVVPNVSVLLAEIENMRAATQEANEAAEYAYGVSTVKVQDEEPTEEHVEIWIDADSEESFASPEIKDDLVLDTDTWSSKKIDKEIRQLSSDIGNVSTKMEIVYPANLLDYDGLSAGFVTPNGALYVDEVHKHTKKIPVTAGDVLSVWRNPNTVGGNYVQAQARFVCAYNANGEAVEASGANTSAHTYQVPDGVETVVITIANSYLDYGIVVKRGTVHPNPYNDVPVYAAPYYRATTDFLPPPYQMHRGFLRREADALYTGGISLTLPGTNSNKNVVYAFTAKIVEMGTINIGYGDTSAPYYTYALIDATNVTWCINGDEYVQAHGLTISGYINVTITINGTDNKGTVKIESGGVTYTRTLVWHGFGNGKYRVKAENGASLTDCVLTVSFQDGNAKVYIYGDSYIAAQAGANKWTHWLIDAGYGDNALINAYPGEDTPNALAAMQNLDLIGKPHYLLWCLGMNDGSDPDADTPSAQWMEGVQSVIAYCKDNDIIPVFATIPTVPAYNHEAKNTWVRASGYRYVDFAKAVGASASGVWFDGMLSSDNVHPTEQGAKALWHRVLCDFPEITF